MEARVTGIDDVKMAQAVQRSQLLCRMEGIPEATYTALTEVCRGLCVARLAVAQVRFPPMPRAATRHL